MPDEPMKRDQVIDWDCIGWQRQTVQEMIAKFVVGSNKVGFEVEKMTTEGH